MYANFDNSHQSYEQYVISSKLMNYENIEGISVDWW